MVSETQPFVVTAFEIGVFALLLVAARWAFVMVVALFREAAKMFLGGAK